MDRRGFIGSILALGVAPSIVRAQHIMPVRVLEDSLIYIPWEGEDPMFAIMAKDVANLIWDISPPQRAINLQQLISLYRTA